MRAQKTFQPKAADQSEKWFVVNAEGLIVGRVAARIAKVLRGKNLPSFAPHACPNHHVIVVNAEKVVFTADKARTKTYYWHTIYRTGLKATTPEKMMSGKPEEILRRAIRGMVPKNALGRRLMRYVRIYKGPEHPHQAQKPQVLPIHTRQVRSEE